MSTLHRFAEGAVRRDLQRARVVLASGLRLSTERRYALADHLAWMSGMVESPDPAIAEAAGALFGTACGFRAEGDRAHRIDLLGATGSMLRHTAHARGWTSPEVLRGLGEHIPWLLDGVSMPPGAGLVLREPGGREVGRIRAATYRKTKAQLWGPVALADLARERETAFTGS
jgi:hypothetical protein